MNWTDERVEQLKKLWAEGLSASQIAAQLGGVSRNAVIGKVHRLNLPGRAKSGGSATPQARPAAPKRPAAPVTPSAPAPVAAATPAAPRAPSYTPPPRMTTQTITRPQGATMVQENVEVEAVDNNVPFKSSANVVVPIFRRLGLTELTERTCKWPMGDPMTQDFHFCGCDSPDTSPYCTYHQKLAYQPMAERRRAAARAG